MAEPPPWRRLYDALEQAVGPRLESLVRTEEFVRAVALAQSAQATARQQAATVSARLWHLVNLPAGTDVARLRAQLGALDREVRRLSLQLEQERANHRVERRSDPPTDPPTHASEDQTDAGTRSHRARPAQPRRTRAPRRGAQRPASP
jgi:hypothetical protein